VGGNSIMVEIIDIDTKSESELGRRLSNFRVGGFTFGGVECRSLESILQAFKFKDIEYQKKMCSRNGFHAWQYGHQGNSWKKEQILWWNGIAYKRESKEYQELLDRLYNECYSQNKEARETLIKTRDAKLTHKRGKTDMKDTVLTAGEFIYRLVRIRKELSK
jgi:hypothetical protein